MCPSRASGRHSLTTIFVIPADAGIQIFYYWIPVFTGMTSL